MEEEKLDVTPESSTGTEENVVNTEQVATPEPETQEQADASQVAEPVVKDNRPIENVAWEVKRKLDETIPSLQNEIRELKSYIESNSQTKQQSYSKPQLQAYAYDPNTSTEQRLWALTEVDKIEKAERMREYSEQSSTIKKNTEAESRRRESANWVAQNFPDTVVKDQTGNVMGWNNQSEILARANQYMSSDETLRNHPEGFKTAVKLAAFDMGGNLSNKVNKTVAQLRKEQKKQLVSAGGTKPTENPKNVNELRYKKLQESYAKTGNVNDLTEIIKMRGMNPFV